MLQRDAVCCSRVQCAAVGCCVLQWGAACCSVLRCVERWDTVRSFVLSAVCCSVLQCFAVCCSELQCVAMQMCCNVGSSVLQ